MNSDPLIGPVKYKGRYGYINDDGEFTIKPVFEFLGRFSEGLACFRREGRFGFIDTEGHTAIDPIFETLRLEGPIFSDGLAAVGLTGQVRYINRSGEVEIPRKFAIGLDFIKGLTVVKDEIERAGYHVMNRAGNPVSYLDVYEVPDVSGWPFSWDSFGCFFMRDEELYVGVLNSKGECVFPPKYRALTDFCDGVAGFCENDEQPGVYGLVKLSGEVLREPSFLRMGNFEEGLASAGRAPKQFGYINTAGDWIVEPKFRQACRFSEGLACVTAQDGTWRGRKGFINSQGEMIIEPRFFREATFRGGYAQVEYDGKRAVIDATGHVIWETKIEPE